MDMSFWAAYALDDNGFDRLLRRQHIDALDNNDWGGVFLCRHIHAPGFDPGRPKDIVFRNAVRFPGNLCGVTPDIVVTLLQRTRSIGVPDGIYSVGRYRDVHFPFGITPQTESR